MWTPWGKSQSISVVAEGIQSISTASHGGIKLYRSRNAKVPKYMRSPGGWYEEDCEFSIAVTVFPEEFSHVYGNVLVEKAKDTFRNWFPDHYEEFYGETLVKGQSYKRDQKLFGEENKDRYIVISALMSEVEGMVDVWATLGGCRGNDSNMIRRRVSSEAYANRNRFGYVLSQEEVDDEIS